MSGLTRVMTDAIMWRVLIQRVGEMLREWYTS
jgi:hypothetical protein